MSDNPGNDESEFDESAFDESTFDESAFEGIDFDDSPPDSTIDDAHPASTDNPFGALFGMGAAGAGAGAAGNPFAGIPMFSEIAKLMHTQGPLNWDVARQMAMSAATGGHTEANVDPLVRIAFNDLARIADMHIQNLTGLDTTVDGRNIEIATTTPGGWAQRTLDAYKPLMTELATSLGQRGPTGDDAEPGDPFAAMLTGIGQMMGPSMLGMAVGGMVGQLGARAFGQYDLPIPRPRSHELLVVPATIDGFAKAWSLAVDELRLWACLQEIASHAVLNVAHVRAELERLLRTHVAGFRPDASALMDKLEGLEFGDGDPASALQRTLGDPEVLLGAVQTPEQIAQLPRLDAIVATIIGYVDHVVDRAAGMLLGSHRQIGEAVRRRRVESSPEDIFVERLLGLRLSRQQVERGRTFVDGVLERAGEDGLSRLFAAAGSLPTPAEIDAPGLWLARLDIG